MTQLSRLEGVLGPLISPRINGETDILSFVRVMNHAISADTLGHRIRGFWLFGDTAESSRLYDTERTIFLRAAMKRLAGSSMSMVVNVTAHTLDGVLRYSHEAEESGVHALAIRPDYIEGIDYAKPVEEIIRRTSLPVVLYIKGQCPSYEVVRDLSQNPRVIGMKISGNKFDDFLKYADLSSDTFGVLQGITSQFEETIRYMAEHERRLDGVVLGPVNFDPKLVLRAFYGIAFKGGSLEDNWREINQIVEGYMKTGNNIQYIKRQLLFRGLIESAELLDQSQEPRIAIPDIETTLRILGTRS